MTNKRKAREYVYDDSSKMHGSGQHAPIDLTDDAENAPPPLGEPPRKRNAKLPLQPTICSCTQPPAVEDLVECSDLSCLVRIYHRACVGLANRVKYADTSKWRCRTCRIAPSSQLPTPSQPPSAPPVVPTVAPVLGPLGQEPNLHPEQLEVVRCIEAGRNTFYTGSAGTGKSTVAKAFNQALKAQGKQVDNIAPSGIAALAIGGSTIFSYAGWHPNSFKVGIAKLLDGGKNKSVRKRLCKTDVLVIDEISMVESDMFTRLDAIMRDVRHNYKPPYGEKPSKSPHSARLPFGGAQIVVTGDFCQLPPVKPFQYCLQCGGDETEGYNRQDSGLKKCKICRKEFSDEDKWAFRSPAWEAAKFTCFQLKQIHRQSDVQFINILQKCRTGTRLQEVEQKLLLQPKGNMSAAVKLLPQKHEVLRQNQEGLSRLRSSPKNYECLDFFDFRNPNEPDLAKKGLPANPANPTGPLAALRDHRFEEQVEIKLDMLVILLVNLDLPAGLVNGSQGKVVGFEAYDPNKTLVPQPPRSPSKNGKKSERADVVSELATIKEDQMRRFIERTTWKEWPVVQFNNGIIRTIYAACQINELGSEKPHSLLGRTQIPLLAAWAITIHKSQGMTLDNVSVDLFNSFEKEMVYVALSRARSLAGLEVLRLPRSMKQGMNSQVMEFLSVNKML